MSGRTIGFILGAATMLLVALSTGAAVYLLLFAAMAAMLIAGLVSALLAMFSARVAVRCPVRTVERGGRVAVTVTVRHKSIIPIKSMRLIISTPDHPDIGREIELNAPPLRGRTYEYMLDFPHRGVFRVGVEKISVADLFELFRFTKKIRAGSIEVAAYPRVQPMEPIDLSSGDTGPQTLTRMTEDAAEPSDVRLWQDGDPLKKIHWKLSMRKRELMVRTYEESVRPDTLILVDLSPVGAVRPISLSYEDAVCETAVSVALAQLSAAYPVRMPLTSETPMEIMGQSGVEGNRFVEALCRVKFDSPYTYEQVLALEMRRMQRTGGVVMVTTRLTARIADTAMQIRRGGLQVRVYVIAEGKRTEAEELMYRMMNAGITAVRVSPWDATTISREERTAV